VLVDLETHRIRANKIFLSILWLHVPLNVGVFIIAQAAWFGLGLATVALAAAATLTCFFAPNQEAKRITLAIAYIATISLLLAGMQGRGWQVDIHMYYFAALAILSIYCDWRVIVAAAAAVAVHHLALNFLLPLAVYPGGSDLGRVVLHAVILISEAAGLIWLAQGMTKMFAIAGQHFDQARQAQAAAEAQTAEAQAAEAQAAQQAHLQSVAAQEAMRRQIAEDQNKVVETLATALEKFASGDLAQRIDEPFAGQYEKLRADFNAAITRMRDTMSVIAQNSGAIRSGTDDISRAADDLSRRTEQQSASLEEAAAALDEITATVRKAAEGANHARNVVSSAKASAEQSGTVVRQAIDAMGGIEKSSQQIRQIIGVIDEIAFQTNLLALNAGVEAARAGDSGRGFAVVASEVRALAQRSAEAAKEIKGLISASTRQVGEGVALVGDTGKALEQIITQVAELNKVITAIAASSHEQATGLNQVNSVVTQMDQSTQQNAAMVEETTVASHALAQQTQELASLIGRFKLGHDVPAPKGAQVTQLHRRPQKPASLAAAPKAGYGAAATRKAAPAPAGNWEDF
jgi:methyl-accepting chemotaxis protein